MLTSALFEPLQPVPMTAACLCVNNYYAIRNLELNAIYKHAINMWCQNKMIN